MKIFLIFLIKLFHFIWLNLILNYLFIIIFLFRNPIHFFFFKQLLIFIYLLIWILFIFSILLFLFHHIFFIIIWWIIFLWYFLLIFLRLRFLFGIDIWSWLLIFLILLFNNLIMVNLKFLFAWYLSMILWNLLRWHIENLEHWIII